VPQLLLCLDEELELDARLEWLRCGMAVDTHLFEGFLGDEEVGFGLVLTVLYVICV
jgi:hypothetical protein